MRQQSGYGLGRTDNEDASILLEFEEMAIARDDQIGLCGQRASEHVVIVRIREHDRNDRRRMHKLRKFRIA